MLLSVFWSVLSDTFVMCLLLLDTVGFSFIVQSSSRHFAFGLLGAVFALALVFHYLLTYFWVYALLYTAGVVALVSVLLAVLIVHVWLDSTEGKAKEKVRRHRDKMRALKAELLALREAQAYGGGSTVSSAHRRKK